MTSTGSNEEHAKGDLLPHFFCNRCYNTIYGDEKRCSDCGKLKPHNGFPDIESSLDPWLGRIIAGRYFVSKRVGRGGTGSVYRVQVMPYGRTLAIKIVDFANLPADSPVHTLEKRLEREVVALRKLQSPHIVQLYEVLDLPDNVVGVVMDYIHGQTLDQIVTSCGALPPKRALSIIQQIADGVYDAHKAGMIHRDLKPENIMVEQFDVSRDFINILDFGVVRIDDGLRLTHGFLGTPLYASPEQAMAREVDNRTDIYSLGAILFFILTGHPPFEYDSIFEILQAHTQANLPTLQEAAQKPFHPKLEELVRKLLAKEPEDRPSNLAEVYEMVEELLAIDLETIPPTPAVDGASVPIIFPKIHELEDPTDPTDLTSGTEDPAISTDVRQSTRFTVKPYDHRPGHIDDILDSLDPQPLALPQGRPNQHDFETAATDPGHHSAIPKRPSSDSNASVLPDDSDLNEPPTSEVPFQPEERESGPPEFTSHWRELERVRLHELPVDSEIIDFSSSHDACSIALLCERGDITQITWQGKISRAASKSERVDNITITEHKTELHDSTVLFNDSAEFFIGTESGIVYSLDKSTNQLKAIYSHPSESPVTQLASASNKFNRKIAAFANGDIYVAGDGIGHLKAGVHNEQRKTWVRIFKEREIEAVAIAQDGESFAIVEPNQGLAIYSFATPGAAFAISPVSGVVVEAIFSQDGHVVALLRDDSIIELRHTISGSKLTTLYDPEHCLKYVSFGTNGGFLGYFIQNRQLWAIDLQREMIRST